MRKEKGMFSFTHAHGEYDLVADPGRAVIQTAGIWDGAVRDKLNMLWQAEHAELLNRVLELHRSLKRRLKSSRWVNYKTYEGSIS